MNDFESDQQVHMTSDESAVAKGNVNTRSPIALTCVTIGLSLLSFLLVKDQFGVALSLLLPMATTLTVFATVIYFNDIS